MIFEHLLHILKRSAINTSQVGPSAHEALAKGVAHRIRSLVHVVRIDGHLRVSRADLAFLGIGLGHVLGRLRLLDLIHDIGQLIDASKLIKALQRPFQFSHLGVLLGEPGILVLQILLEALKLQHEVAFHRFLAFVYLLNLLFGGHTVRFQLKILNHLFCVVVLICDVELTRLDALVARLKVLAQALIVAFTIELVFGIDSTL